MYGSNFFEFLAEDPEREASFAAAMKIQEFAPATARPRFSFDDGIRDFTTSASAGGSDVFFVDVGGGQGQYLNTLIQWHPEMPGRKVLQDLPTVVAGVPKDTSTFEPMGHDFFKPQSVQGAKYYHLRGILHDWPDNECLQILSQLRAAFEPDYSRLLVQSMILPETDYALFDTMLDINMWTCCGIERTLNQWDALLQKAGFQVVNVVRAEVGSFGIIEAKAAHDARSS